MTIYLGYIAILLILLLFHYLSINTLWNLTILD